MKKYWLIDGNTFFVRDNAKEFLAVEWNRDPEKYLRNEDIASYFNNYLCENKYYCLDSWLLKTSRATETQLKEMQNTVKQFFADFLDEVIENVVDDWLVEEEETIEGEKEELDEPYTFFYNIKEGATFKYNGELYMKINYEKGEQTPPSYQNGFSPDAVSLKNGKLIILTNTTKVEKVESKG